MLWYICSVITRVKQSVVGVVILAIFSYMTLRMQKNVLNMVNINGQCICMHFKMRAKLDQHISDMTAMTV